MKWNKFKDIRPETNTDILYYCRERIIPGERCMVIVYINEDGMILCDPDDTRVEPNPNAYWMILPNEPLDN
jgi:hypothetical protein